MLRSYSKKCRRKFSIRKFSFLKLHHKITASIIINVLENFILLKLNAKQLQSMIEKDYKITFSYSNILEILKNVRYVLADFMKDKYRRNQIGGPPEKKKVVCIDECLMMHENGKQQWVVGAVETSSYKMRFDIIEERNMQNLEIFCNNHIEPGTLVVTDGWSSYRFLDNPYSSVWEHEIHNHGAGDFGYGERSTSHIEHT